MSQIISLKRKKLHTLIVDFDPDMCDLLQTMLSPVSEQVIKAYDCVSALALAKQYKPIFGFP